VAGTADEVLDALEAQNAAYADKFGFVFLVCATGRSAGEMLALLAERLGHGREEEVAIAGEEQRKITALRLGKLAAAEGEGGADTRGRL
jgi:OHCU decarboxylase